MRKGQQHLRARIVQQERGSDMSWNIDKKSLVALAKNHLHGSDRDGRKCRQCVMLTSLAKLTP